MGVDVIVVGGGIAGLSAAYELQARGLSFVLLERTARPGGVCRFAHSATVRSGQIGSERIPRKRVPHPQRRQRNSLRTVRVQTKQPGPNQPI